MDRFARVLVEAYRRGGTMFVFGNGGSAADAQHIAAAVNDELAALAQGRSEATSEKFVIVDQADSQPCSDSPTS